MQGDRAIIAGVERPRYIIMESPCSMRYEHNPSVVNWLDIDIDYRLDIMFQMCREGHQLILFDIPESMVNFMVEKHGWTDSRSIVQKDIVGRKNIIDLSCLDFKKRFSILLIDDNNKVHVCENAYTH